MKNFIKNMEEKYPAFKFKVKLNKKTNMYEITIKLDAIGRVDVEKSLFKKVERQSKIGKMLVEKTLTDYMRVLMVLKENLHKTISEITE